MNPDDEVSFRRIVNVPRRGVGDTSVRRIEAWASAHGTTFGAALAEADRAGVAGKAAAGVRSLLQLLERLRSPADGDVSSTNPAVVLEAVLELTGYRADLEAEHSLEATGRLENLAELVGVASEHEELAAFLEAVALVNDADDLGDDDSRVALMTLHTAKGLEYPAVFMVGMEEGVFPHMRAMGEPDELEEERRLCYVGMTRAREYLHLSHATCRGLWGSVQWNPPSRFLKEVPEMLLRAAGNGAPTSSTNGAGRSGTRGRDALVEEARRAGTHQPGADDRRRAAGPEGRRRRRPRQVGRGRRPRAARHWRQVGGHDPVPGHRREAAAAGLGPAQAGLSAQRWRLFIWAGLPGQPERGCSPVPASRAGLTAAQLLHGLP